MSGDRRVGLGRPRFIPQRTRVLTDRWWLGQLRQRTRYNVVTDAGTVPSVTGSQTFLFALGAGPTEDQRRDAVTGLPEDISVERAYEVQIGRELLTTSRTVYTGTATSQARRLDREVVPPGVPAGRRPLAGAGVGPH